jgi:3-oxoacyl-[acyl-carrier-protein] synthase II
MLKRRVVITGLGALTPIGNTVPLYWDALCRGTSGAAPITRFDASSHKTHFACELNNFNAEDHLERKEARKLDRFTIYALVAAHEAVLQSGINGEGLNRDRIGVIWGSGNGGMDTFQEQILEVGSAPSHSQQRYNPFFIPRILVDMPAGHISIRYGFRGVNFAPISACATSTTALVNAFHYIKFGYADAIVTGGSDAAISPAGIGGFNACKALSTRNSTPATASRPFDTNRDGFVMGEGAGALILEEYEHAKARGATILAELAGGGLSGDAYHPTATHPEGAGAVLAMNAALSDAALSPADIHYLNAHATSTPLGDLSETRAIQTVFGTHLTTLSISATKSQTGHLLGAAGAIEAIASIKACMHDIIPPTINTQEIDPAISSELNIILHTPAHKQVMAAMSSTFGFGGHNAIAIVKKWVE